MANQVWNRLGQITSNYKNSLQAPSLNNNQYSSYYSKLYPGLNEESYNKMVNAVDSLGLTGENRANAMNNYYRTHVKTLINDQTLQERDDIINQQAYEAAKLNNKDADAELRMTEAVQKAKKLWNLDATANDREVFSTMVETLGADGVKLAGQYLSGENDEFLYKTGLKDTTAQEQSKKYNLKRASIQNALVNNWQSLSDDGLKYLRNYNAIFDTVNEARDRGMGEGMSDSELLKELMNYSPELKDLGTEIDRLESKLDFGDKTILGMVDDVYAKDRHEGINMIRDFLGWNSNTPATTADIEQALYTRGAFDDNYVGELGNQLKVYADQPINSIKKKLYRTTKEMENLNSTMDSFWTKIMPKGVAETILGEKMSDEEYKQYIQDRVNENNANIERNKEKVLGYQQKINNAFAEKVAKNLDPEIKDYYDNKSITELMTEGDRNGVGYKQAQSVASNRDMLPNMVITAINAPAGMTLMFGDSYARESQEAFENMLEHGATYEQAQVGGEVVGTVNAIVEVGLDRLLGGVETRTSKNLKNAFMGNLKEEIGKKGFGDILLNAIKEYVSASGEEGLEEVIQQIVGNAAVKTIDNRQDILEGVGEAFEGGALNPMNLMAGGSEILQNKDNIRDSMLEGAYNAGKFSRNVYDTFNSKSIVDNIQNSMLNGAERAGERAGSIYYGTKNLFNKGNQNVTTENVGTETTEKTEKPGVIDRITDWGAEKITNTVSAQDKLYKAQEPRMNTLSKKKDLEKRREHSDRANQLIVQNGYIPTNTAERLEAHETTMKNIWKQVEDKINGGQEIMVDLSQIADVLDEYIQSQRDTKSTLTEGDLAKLEKESQALRGQQVSLPVAERLKQLYNAVINNRGEEKASDTMANGLQKATHEIGVIEDNLLSEIPGEFQGLKNDFGALKDTYEDVFKADMKNQRKKGAGLTETYSRIEGIGDIANGLLGVVTGKGDLASIGKGATKFLVGKSLAKASDVDFLIEQGFKELAKQYGNNGNVTTNTTPTTPTATAPITRTTTEITEDVDVGANPTDLTATEEVVDQEVATTPKKKVESSKMDEQTRRRLLAKEDGTLTYSNGEFKYIPSVQEGLIRLTRKEGEVKLREQIESALSDPRYSINVRVDDEGNGYVYNEGRGDLDELEDKTNDEILINEDSYKGYEIMRDGSTIEFELDPDKVGEEHHYIKVDLQDFLNYSDLSRRVDHSKVEEFRRKIAEKEFEADIKENEIKDTPEEVYDQWEGVTTTPKKKTTKKKTSKKQTENNVKLDTKKIASDYMKGDMDWNKYQHLAGLTEEQALEKRGKFETAIDEEWDKNQDYYNTHQSELVEKFHHLLK